MVHTSPVEPAAEDAAGLLVGDHMSAEVRSVSSRATLREAAHVLAEHRISCLVVRDEDEVVGIISERDLVRAVDCAPDTWAETPVREVMSHPLHVTSTGASVADAIRQLAAHRIRRLPVLGGPGRLAGIVTQTDLLRAAYERLRDYATNLERLVGERTAALAETERRRDDLVDLTAHDIKNSLCVVDTALDVFADGNGDTDILPLLRRAIARMGNLVGTLFEVNRLEGGTMPTRMLEVPWGTVVDAVRKEAEILAQTKSLTIGWTGERHVIVRCDPHLVERVLLNLLDNAVNAAPPDTRIEVQASWRADGGFAVLVGNRGPVIEPHVLANLFTKYTRGDTLPEKRFGGWGLGLTFCRLAVERHGGAIRAFAPWIEGEGTAFELKLPQPVEPGQR